jgi:predicted RNA binding protein YcfA (HicA-like mRNA interferase family)
VSRKLPRDVSGDQVVQVLEKRGWQVHRQKGSHIALEHPDVAPTVVVPHHKSLRIGTLNRILRDAGISRDEFLRLL